MPANATTAEERFDKLGIHCTSAFWCLCVCRDPKIADFASELLRDVFGEETISSRLVFVRRSNWKVVLEVKP